MAHTPGWNDPPPLSFSQSSQPGLKRTLLNKRVPHPLTQVTPSLNTDVSSQLPVTTATIPPNHASQTAPCESVEKNRQNEPDDNVPVEEILPIIIDIFDKILAENAEKQDAKRLEEINRRLDALKNSWGSKISTPVKQKMLKLAQELSKGDAESALKIQCALMVDHLREVKQWMVGVKHIIEMERLKTSIVDVCVPENNSS